MLNYTIIKNRNTIGHGQRFGLIMRDVDDSNAQLFVNVFYFVLHLLPQILVQGAERLIHKHQVGLEHQRPCHRHALLLAARELAGPTATEVGQANHVQRSLDFCLNLRFRNPSNF